MGICWHPGHRYAMMETHNLAGNCTVPERRTTMEHEIVWKDRKRVWCGLPWTFTKYELSKEKLIIKTGFFTQNQDEVRLYRILDLSLKRSLIQRMFGLGTVICYTGDVTNPEIHLEHIKHAKEIKKETRLLIKGTRENITIHSK